MAARGACAAAGETADHRNFLGAEAHRLLGANGPPPLYSDCASLAGLMGARSLKDGKVEAYRTKVKISFKYEGKD